ncbi:GNAT family N-acetyltransferase [Rhodobaculum claviforme]|uniref:GNAT family N-acetyltransferase n=1 Tax=Rhodobaculum claviforme TaxID=1549854 RepID=A0A934TNL7_9RHOB|nr:GNAT family N-acetyltransferase [Rhodobaculum claviforme]MBK5928587.1 GNAT family N-acetyltransferase [Rhodobaculum claviforme]
MTHTPVLETERLRLRAPAPCDFEAWAAYKASARSRFTGAVQDRPQAWRGFCGLIGHWAVRGYGMFILTRHGDDAALGMVGPWFPEGWPGQEIGWMLFDAALEGQGLAQEAALAARAHAYDVLGWPTAISLIDPENAASEALARRLGCVAEGLADLPGFGPAGVWRHPGPDTLAEGGMEAYA